MNASEEIFHAATHRWEQTRARAELDFNDAIFAFNAAYRANGDFEAFAGGMTMAHVSRDEAFAEADRIYRRPKMAFLMEGRFEAERKRAAPPPAPPVLTEIDGNRTA